MKTLTKTALLATLLSSTMMADVVFDLGAQQLSNSVNKSYKDSTYDITTAIVSTALAYENGSYHPISGGTGNLSVQIKDPKPNWGVTFGVYCYLGDDGCNVALLGADSSTLNIGFDYDSINIEGTHTEDANFDYSETITGTVQTTSTGIEVVINGEYKYTIDKPNFKLAHISVQLNGHDSSNIGDKYMDKLNSLAISTSD